LSRKISDDPSDLVLHVPQADEERRGVLAIATEVWGSERPR